MVYIILTSFTQCRLLTVVCVCVAFETLKQESESCTQLRRPLNGNQASLPILPMCTMPTPGAILKAAKHF